MISKTWTISAEEGRRMAAEMKAKAQAENPVEALAEAYREAVAVPPDTGTEISDAYVVAADILEDLRARGIRLVPEVPTEEMKQAGARAASGPHPDRIDDLIPYDECDNCFRAEWRAEVEMAYRAMLDAAPGAKEEGDRDGPSTD